MALKDFLPEDFDGSYDRYYSGNNKQYLEDSLLERTYIQGNSEVLETRHPIAWGLTARLGKHPAEQHSIKDKIRFGLEINRREIAEGYFKGSIKRLIEKENKKMFSHERKTEQELILEHLKNENELFYKSERYYSEYPTYNEEALKEIKIIVQDYLKWVEIEMLAQVKPNLKKKLTLRQIALIYIYNGEYININNASTILEHLTQTSTQKLIKLYDKFRFENSRIGEMNPREYKALRKDITEILSHLSGESKDKANRELQTIENKIESFS